MMQNFVKRFKKHSLKRKRFERVERFSLSNIFIYLGLLVFLGYFCYQILMQRVSVDDKVDLSSLLIVLCVFIVLSGIATIIAKRTIDYSNLRVIRGNQAILSGVKMVIFGIFLIFLIMFGKQ